MKLIYHPDVFSQDLPRINRDMKLRIKKAIEERLATAPDRYGQRLRKGLGGYWKMRVGDYRIVYKITAEEIKIIIIGHRKDVYSHAVMRK